MYNVAVNICIDIPKAFKLSNKKKNSSDFSNITIISLCLYMIIYKF